MKFDDVFPSLKLKQIVSIEKENENLKIKEQSGHLAIITEAQIIGGWGFYRQDHIEEYCVDKQLIRKLLSDIRSSADSALSEEHILSVVKEKNTHRDLVIPQLEYARRMVHNTLNIIEKELKL